MMKYYCVECNNIINKSTYYRNKGQRCISCAIKYKWSNKKYKKRISLAIRKGKESVFKKKMTKKFLIKEYVENKKSGTEIAKIIGCSVYTVYRQMNFYNIKRRNNKEVQMGKYNKNSIIKHHVYLKENSEKVIILNRSHHRKLHQKAYAYLYEKYGEKGINDYLKWFKRNIKNGII